MTHHTFRTIVALTLCTAITAQAATCRSGNAASQGSQVGYQRDQQAASQAAQSELSSSDILGKCVGGITSIITAPQFPSLSDIFDQVKNKVCQIASSEVNGALSDVNGKINGVLGDINDKINSATNVPGIGPALGNPSPVKLPSVQQTPPGSPQTSAFWSDIWK